MIIPQLGNIQSFAIPPLHISRTYELITRLQNPLRQDQLPRPFIIQNVYYWYCSKIWCLVHDVLFLTFVFYQSIISNLRVTIKLIPSQYRPGWINILAGIYLWLFSPYWLGLLTNIGDIILLGSVDISQSSSPCQACAAFLPVESGIIRVVFLG